MTIPRVTIITPSLNSRSHIEETINSVLGQQYPFLEYLIFDGGSTDGTVDILKHQTDQVHWVVERDKGQSDAINKGLLVASGEIVGWLNSNDLLLPASLSRVGNYFANHPEVDIVFGKAKVISETGEIIGDYEEVGRQNEVSEIMTRLNEVAKGHFDRVLNYHPGWIPQMTAFWRIHLSKEVGYLDPRLHYAMDYEYWLRLGSRGRIHFIDDFLGAFRLHGGAKSANAAKLWREILLVNRRYDGTLLSPLHRLFLKAAWMAFWKRVTPWGRERS